MNDDEEIKAVREADRARQARAIVENPLFKEAVDACNDHIWGQFAKSEFSDDQTRRNARIALDLLDRLLKNLKRHIETGKMADQNLVNIEDERKRKGIFQRYRKIS